MKISIAELEANLTQATESTTVKTDEAQALMRENAQLRSQEDAHAKC